MKDKYSSNQFDGVYNGGLIESLENIFLEDDGNYTYNGTHAQNKKTHKMEVVEYNVKKNSIRVVVIRAFILGLAVFPSWYFAWHSKYDITWLFWSILSYAFLILLVFGGFGLLLMKLLDDEDGGYSYYG